jgi:hypothetical protein
MAYVANVAAFIEYSLFSGPGCHVYNSVGKPDSEMNTLIATVPNQLGKGERSRLDSEVPREHAVRDVGWRDVVCRAGLAGRGAVAYRVPQLPGGPQQ